MDSSVSTQGLQLVLLWNQGNIPQPSLFNETATSRPEAVLCETDNSDCKADFEDWKEWMFSKDSL